MVKFLFYFSFIIVFYSYIGYGILLFLLVKARKLFHNQSQFLPEAEFEPLITLIVPAYNESGFIRQKIENCRQLDYPSEKLKLLFITDGSDDGTMEYVKAESDITLLHQMERGGKAAALNRAMKLVNTEYVLFSDANTLLNPEAIRKIVAHYQNPKVGGVAGEKKVISGEKGQASAAGEGMYWKYESWLKKLDSELNTVVGAAGELFSLQTRLYRPTAENTIIEDFILSMQICEAGYQIRYEPNAIATEAASLSMKEEQKRKVRIAAGAFQAMGILSGIFNIFRYPVLSFQFISHRILRWTLCPLCLLVFTATNAILIEQGNKGIYLVVFLLQTVFYALALLGWIFANRNIKIKVLYIPYYFLFMNLSVFIGFSRWLKRKQPAAWERADRQNLP